MEFEGFSRLMIDVSEELPEVRQQQWELLLKWGWAARQGDF